MQGSLSEFRLAEILQLVAVQQKTGLLRLARHSTTVVFYFDNGVLVSCRDRRHVIHDPLFLYVTRTGWLAPEAATYLRDRLEDSKEDLADVLVGERFLSEEARPGMMVRLGMPYRTWDRMPAATRQALLDKGDDLLTHIEEL
jgi:hypothetical protein